MSVGENISKAKEWCKEARKVLKLGTFNSQGNTMTARVEKIGKELIELQKAINKNDSPLTQQKLDDYGKSLSEITLALKNAATQKDQDAVSFQASKLRELKRELAVFLTKSTKSKTTAENKFKETLAVNFDTEKQKAVQHLTALKNHGGAAAIAVEIATIERDFVTLADTKHRDRADEEARNLLLRVAGECVAPKGIADNYLAYVNRLGMIELDLKNLANPDNIVTTELTSIRTTKVDEAKKKAVHTVRDYVSANVFLDQAHSEYLKAKAISDGYVAFKSAKTTATNAYNLLKNHAGKQYITKESAAIQTDWFDKATPLESNKKWAEAKEIYTKATAAINKLSTLAQKLNTDTKYYKSWGIDRLAILTKHAQKANFTEEITSIEKQLESARQALLNNAESLAEKQLTKIYFDCEAIKKEMDSHGTYLTKRKNEFDTKFKKLPANTDPDFANDVKAIEAQLASANKRADRRLYADATRTLQEAIDACVALEKIVNDRKSYQQSLSPIETAVGLLPADTDPVIGAESKVVRAMLAQAKSLATSKDFKAANDRLPAVKTACDAANQLAARQADSKRERDSAVGQTDPATALAEVRKLVEKLKTHAQATAIDKQLKEMEKFLSDADSALKA